MCVAFLQPYKSTGGRRVEFPPYLGGRSWSANTDFFASMNSYLPPLIPFHQPTAACSVKWLFIVCLSVSPLSPIPSNRFPLFIIPSDQSLHSVKWLSIVCHSVSPQPPIPSAHSLLFRQLSIVRHSVSPLPPVPSNGCSLCVIPSNQSLHSVKGLFIVCHSINPRPPIFRQMFIDLPLCAI